MSEKKSFKSEIRNLAKDNEKILYGENKSVCFACGEEIDKNAEICPYCKTTLK
ncbi:MAG: hypothetical protein ACFFA4_10840 [Promethearchaeota archaeon]